MQNFILKPIEELRIKKYVASKNINPKDVFYQRITSQNAGTSLIEFNVSTPNKFAHLLALSEIEYNPTITRYAYTPSTTTKGAAEGVVNNQVMCSLNYGGITGAATNINLQINGASKQLTEPRHFMDMLLMMYGNNEKMKMNFPDNFGFIDLDGQATGVVATKGLNSQWSIQDKALLKKEANFFDKIRRARGVSSLNGLNNFSIKIMEPVIVPPFNPFFGCEEDLPDYCWFKGMSNVIPNIDKLNLYITFHSKLAASMLLPRYLGISNDADKSAMFDISAMSADWILYWYVPQTPSPIQKISIQSWDIREYQTDLGDLANGATAAVTNTSLIQLTQGIPSLITIHAQSDMDRDGFNSLALTSDYNQGGAQPSTIVNDNRNALLPYCELSSLEVTLGDKAYIISSKFTQQQLYNLTVKNCDYKNFPYDFETWRGLIRARHNVANEVTNTFTMSKCFIALQPHDLSMLYSAGDAMPTSLQFTFSAIARDGLEGITGSNTSAADTNVGSKNYRLYVHVFYGKELIEITPESASIIPQYKMPVEIQRVSPMVATTNVGTVLVSPEQVQGYENYHVGAGMVSGGSSYISRMP